MATFGGFAPFGSGQSGSAIFGAAASTPQRTASNAAPAFGTPSAFGAAPAFGATNAFGAAPAFGASSNAFAAPSFGAAAAPAFGAAAPAAGAATFGTTSSFNAGGGFGFGTAPAAGGLTFGAAAPAFGSGFAAPAAAAAPSSANIFGATGFGTGFGFTTPAAPQPALAPQQLCPPATKFSELPEAMRKSLLEMDSFIQQQSVIRDEISTHSSPLENSSMQIVGGGYDSKGTANGSGGVSNSLRASIESISTQISSLSLKLNAELLQLSAFESAVSEQYREGEAAQRHATKLLSQVYPGGDGRGGTVGGSGVTTTLGGGPVAAQMRSSVSLSDKMTLPSPYHWSKLQEWVTGVTALRTQVAVVEEYLATASASAHTHASFASPQALSHVLSAHHAALLGVTARVAGLHDQVALVRDKFTSMFGREGRLRLEEERNKEHQKKEAFDLNAPNTAPLVSSTAQSTSLQSASVAAAAAGTTAAPAAAAAPAGLSFGAAPTAGAAAAPLTFGAAPAAGAATFGGFGAPAAGATPAFGAPGSVLSFGAPALPFGATPLVVQKAKDKAKKK